MIVHVLVILGLIGLVFFAGWIKSQGGGLPWC